MPVRRAISDWLRPARRRRLINSEVGLMHSVYAMSHSKSMPHRIMRTCIVLRMDPHRLIARLVQDAGGALPVAKAMGKPTFQGTLHKICAGGVASPKRDSAQRIADHFKIPVDALYDPQVADAVWAARFGSAAPMTVRPPAVTQLTAKEAVPGSIWLGRSRPSVGSRLPSCQRSCCSALSRRCVPGWPS